MTYHFNMLGSQDYDDWITDDENVTLIED